MPPVDEPRRARYAGLVAASAFALVWTALARREPTTTYHLAPLVVAASWGVARRWSARRRGTRREGLVAAVGGAAVAAVTLVELDVAGALRGPTIWGGGAAVGESVALLLLGALLGFRAVTRRRPGLLFAA